MGCACCDKQQDLVGKRQIDDWESAHVISHQQRFVFCHFLPRLSVWTLACTHAAFDCVHLTACRLLAGWKLCSSCVTLVNTCVFQKCFQVLQEDSVELFVPPFVFCMLSTLIRSGDKFGSPMPKLSLVHSEAVPRFDPRIRLTCAYGCVLSECCWWVRWENCMHVQSEYEVGSSSGWFLLTRAE